MAGGMIQYVQILETRPMDVTVRRWREIRHGAMRAMGLHWHQTMLPQHFGATPGKSITSSGDRRPTTNGNWQQPQRDATAVESSTVEPVPTLTFSGTLRANVTQVATIRTFESRFKLIMPGTPYTPDRPRRPNQPPIAQEITKLLEREKQELAKIGKAFAKDALNQKTQAVVTDL